MTDFGLFHLLVLPASLGLIGFIEPCSIGSSLVFVKYLERKGASLKLAETLMFAVTRAVLIGALGVLAAFVGSAFLGLQKGAWIALGVLYLLIGALYVTGRAKRVMVAIGPRLARFAGSRGAIGLGVLFGLNIPACAAPLLGLLLGRAAAGGASGETLVSGFVALAAFGMALSLPILLVVLFAPARRMLDVLAAFSDRVPLWTGVLLLVLGLWTIAFALVAELPTTG